MVDPVAGYVNLRIVEHNDSQITKCISLSNLEFFALRQTAPYPLTGLTRGTVRAHRSHGAIPVVISHLAHR